MNEEKIAEMDRLHGDLARVIYNVDPDASVSITLYDESSAKVSVSNSNYTRKLINELIAKGLAVIGVYSNLHVDHIRVVRPCYRVELLVGVDRDSCNPLIFSSSDKNVVIDMAKKAMGSAEKRGGGEKVLAVSNYISLDGGRTWDFVGPYDAKNDEYKTFLQVQLGVSSFQISFNFNVL